MTKQYEMHVISNTHWDREWLFDFQETRMMLVEFFDQLLDLLDKRPEYRSYVLDSQTVPIEDYLEVRPEQEERIRKHVEDGRLLVGPWYTCPEGFCVNGESLVRNLLYGHRVANAFGRVMKVGHTPFSYGQNSQMPQIYRGFGIDTMLFYHGVSHDDTANEFIWEGADGTRIFGSQMSSFARYNFYFFVYRPVVYGTSIDERTYSWRTGGLPFHLCSDAYCMGHHILLDPQRGFRREKIAECVAKLRDMEIATATTKHLVFMQGHDSSVADEAELEIIAEAQNTIGRDRLFHSSLPELIEKIKASARNLEVLKGERRVPKPMGARIHLYSDVLSSRTRMKRLNAHAEYLLQRWAEPYACVASWLGAEYPASLLDLAWKTLLKCHAHDSIAGSGVDDIELDVRDRLRQVTNISKGVMTRGLQHIQACVDNSDAGEDDVLLTVFNPSPYPRTEVLTALVDLPATNRIEPIALEEVGRNRRLPVQVVWRRPHNAVVNHAWDATAMMACERVRFHFEAQDVPAMGYATYRVTRVDHKAGSLACGAFTAENEHLQLILSKDGSLLVAAKEIKHPFLSLNTFVDDGEAGHAWMHIEPAQDTTVVSGPSQRAMITLEESGPLLVRFKVTHRMQIPAGLDENGGDPARRLDGAENASRRTAETHELVITSFITLRKGARSVEVTTRVNNTARNHRLRVAFPTGLETKKCSVESAFDVVERDTEYAPGSPWADAVRPTFPMQRFVDVSDGKTGLAIINDGLREYEVHNGTIYMTLLRAYEVSLTTVSKRWDVHPEMGLSQCPGEHEFRYLIYPHRGRWDAAEVYREAERLTVPMEMAQVGRHSGDLPKRQSFLRIEPANVILSALKRSEDGAAWVVRLFNPTNKPLTAKLTLFRPVRTASLVNLEEKPLRKLVPRGGSLSIPIAKKKVVTLKITL